MKFILKGTGVCGGCATGKAKIVKNVTQAPEMEDGCILVMRFFSPALVMLISKAAAVLADFGGVTSHAAVIAREFNVPCIVGLNDATTKIKDGQLIHMDAGEGAVYEL